LLSDLPEHSKNTIIYHATKDPHRDSFILSGDDDRFTSHSDTPNTSLSGDDVIAAELIPLDTEIIADYSVGGMSIVPTGTDQQAL
jgi:hypothetical protein